MQARFKYELSDDDVMKYEKVITTVDDIMDNRSNLEMAPTLLRIIEINGLDSHYEAFNFACEMSGTPKLNLQDPDHRHLLGLGMVMQKPETWSSQSKSDDERWEIFNAFYVGFTNNQSKLNRLREWEPTIDTAQDSIAVAAAAAPPLAGMLMVGAGVVLGRVYKNFASSDGKINLKTLNYFGEDFLIKYADKLNKISGMFTVEANNKITGYQYEAVQQSLAPHGEITTSLQQDASPQVYTVLPSILHNAPSTVNTNLPSFSSSLTQVTNLSINQTKDNPIAGSTKEVVTGTLESVSASAQNAAVASSPSPVNATAKAPVEELHEDIRQTQAQVDKSQSEHINEGDPRNPQQLPLQFHAANVAKELASMLHQWSQMRLDKQAFELRKNEIISSLRSKTQNFGFSLEISKYERLSMSLQSWRSQLCADFSNGINSSFTLKRERLNALHLELDKTRDRLKKNEITDEEYEKKILEIQTGLNTIKRQLEAIEYNPGPHLLSTFGQLGAGAANAYSACFPTVLPMVALGFTAFSLVTGAINNNAQERARRKMAKWEAIFQRNFSVMQNYGNLRTTNQNATGQLQSNYHAAIYTLAQQAESSEDRKKIQALIAEHKEKANKFKIELQKQKAQLDGFYLQRSQIENSKTTKDYALKRDKAREKVKSDNAKNQHSLQKNLDECENKLKKAQTKNKTNDINSHNETIKNIKDLAALLGCQLKSGQNTYIADPSVWDETKIEDLLESAAAAGYHVESRADLEKYEAKLADLFATVDLQIAKTKSNIANCESLVDNSNDIATHLGNGLQHPECLKALNHWWATQNPKSRNPGENGQLPELTDVEERELLQDRAREIYAIVQNKFDYENAHLSGLISSLGHLADALRRIGYHKPGELVQMASIFNNIHRTGHLLYTSVSKLWGENGIIYGKEGIINQFTKGNISEAISFFNLIANPIYRDAIIKQFGGPQQLIIELINPTIGLWGSIFHLAANLCGFEPRNPVLEALKNFANEFHEHLSQTGASLQLIRGECDILNLKADAIADQLATVGGNVLDVRLAVRNLLDRWKEEAVNSSARHDELANKIRGLAQENGFAKYKNRLSKKAHSIAQSYLIHRMTLSRMLQSLSNELTSVYADHLRSAGKTIEIDQDISRSAHLLVDFFADHIGYRRGHDSGKLHDFTIYYVVTHHCIKALRDFKQMTLSDEDKKNLANIYDAGNNIRQFISTLLTVPGYFIKQLSEIKRCYTTIIEKNTQLQKENRDRNTEYAKQARADFLETYFSTFGNNLADLPRRPEYHPSGFDKFFIAETLTRELDLLLPHWLHDRELQEAGLSAGIGLGGAGLLIGSGASLSISAWGSGLSSAILSLPSVLTTSTATVTPLLGPAVAPYVAPFIAPTVGLFTVCAPVIVPITFATGICSALLLANNYVNAKEAKAKSILLTIQSIVENHLGCKVEAKEYDIPEFILYFDHENQVFKLIVDESDFRAKSLYVLLPDHWRIKHHEDEPVRRRIKDRLTEKLNCADYANKYPIVLHCHNSNLKIYIRGKKIKIDRLSKLASVCPEKLDYTAKNIAELIAAKRKKIETYKNHYNEIVNNFTERYQQIIKYYLARKNYDNIVVILGKTVISNGQIVISSSRGCLPLILPTSFIDYFKTNNKRIKNLYDKESNGFGVVLIDYTLERDDHAGKYSLALTYRLRGSDQNSVKLILAEIDLLTIEAFKNIHGQVNYNEFLTVFVYGSPDDKIGLAGNLSIEIIDGEICPREVPFRGLYSLLEKLPFTKTFCFAHSLYNQTANNSINDFIDGKIGDKAIGQFLSSAERVIIDTAENPHIPVQKKYQSLSESSLRPLAEACEQLKREYAILLGMVRLLANIDDSSIKQLLLEYIGLIDPELILTITDFMSTVEQQSKLNLDNEPVEKFLNHLKNMPSKLLVDLRKLQKIMGDAVNNATAGFVPEENTDSPVFQSNADELEAQAQQQFDSLPESTTTTSNQSYFFSASSNPAQPHTRRRIINTTGDGDCAFHAVLGEIKNDRCTATDAASQRRRIAKLISSAQPEDAIYKIARETLEQTLRDDARLKADEALLPPEIIELKASYAKSIKEHDDEVNKFWKRFEDAILEKRDEDSNLILKYINKDPANTFKLKFDNCLNAENSKLKNMVDANTRLKELYSVYTNSINFKWSNPISQNILSAYGKYLGTPGVYLLSSELEFLAYEFNLAITVYSTRNNHLQGEVVVYQQDRENKVSILHNGHNHFSRLCEEDKRYNTSYSNAKLAAMNMARLFHANLSQSTDSLATPENPTATPTTSESVSLKRSC